ncbi:KR domain-containing protein, partial [Pseudonocardia abyssalis]
AVQELFPELPEIGPEQLSELRTLDQIASFLGGAGGVGPKAPEAGATAPRHRVGLVRLPRIDLIEDPYADEPVALLVDGGGPDGGGPDGDAVASALEASGWTVRRAPGPDLSGPADLVLHLLDGPDVVDALAGAVATAGPAVGALTTAGTRAAYVTVTRLDGELGLSGRCDPERALLGGVGGLVKTLAAEDPAVFARSVDVDPALAPDEFAAALLAELHDAATDTLEVGIGAGGQRCTVVPGRHRPATERSVVDPSAPPPTTTLGADDLLVVTGGARGVTALCVRALAEHSAAAFLLLGRTALADEPAWAAGVPDGELKPAVIDGLRADGGRPTPRDVDRALGELRAGREIRSTLAALGSRARYLAVDVTDADAVRSALAADRDRVTGVVHGAGVLADALLPDKTPEQVRRVFAPKLGGLAAVLGALDGAPLRHLVLFTSVAGLLGNSGQADYAVANEALCRFAASHRARHPEQHVTAIDWGAWDGGMVTDALRELFSARGIPLLDPSAGARAFVEQFTAERVAEICVLIGADTSLAAPRRVPPPAFTAARDLAGLVDDPVIQAHRIGAHPVLPATFGLGWLVAVVERAHPGLTVVEVGDFQVHKGIVFDGPVPERLRVQVDAASVDGTGVRVRAAVRSGDPHGLAPSHYAATLRLAPAPAEPPRSTAHEVGEGPEDALEIYRSAVQFHGPALQGMRRILAADPSDDGRLVVQCRLADSAVADGAFHGRLYSPVLADVLLQGPPVLGHRLLGAPCLPLGIDRVDLYAPLPDDEPFVLVLDGVERRPTGVTVTATACTPDGAVLQRFTGVTVVSTPDLADRFNEAVRHRS